MGRDVAYLVQSSWHSQFANRNTFTPPLRSPAVMGGSLGLPDLVLNIHGQPVVPAIMKCSRSTTFCTRFEDQTNETQNSNGKAAETDSAEQHRKPAVPGVDSPSIVDG